MMNDEELHNAFLKAVEVANNTHVVLPDDVKLRFYAHYKHAVEDDIGFYKSADDVELRSAFKSNALFQVKRLSKKEAKSKYIELVKEFLSIDVLATNS